MPWKTRLVQTIRCRCHESHCHKCHNDTTCRRGGGHSTKILSLSSLGLRLHSLLSHWYHVQVESKESKEELSKFDEVAASESLLMLSGANSGGGEICALFFTGADGQSSNFLFLVTISYHRWPSPSLPSGGGGGAAAEKVGPVMQEPEVNSLSFGNLLFATFKLKFAFVWNFYEWQLWLGGCLLTASYVSLWGFQEVVSDSWPGFHISGLLSNLIRI